MKKIIVLFLMIILAKGLMGQLAYFQRLNGPIGGSVKCISVRNNGDIYVGLDDSQGIYKSTDNALSWQQLGNVPDNTIGTLNIISDIKVKPNGELFVSTNSDIYHSSDDGATWQHIGTSSNYIRSIEVKNNNIYIGACRLQYSGNNGLNFTETQMKASFIAINSNDVVFTGSDCYSGVFKSFDNGTSYTQCSISGFVSSIVIDSADNIYAGFYSNGGIYKSTDDGTTWSRIDSGFAISSIIKLDINEHQDLFCLTSDNKLHVLYHGTSLWQELNLNLQFPKCIFYDNVHEQLLAGTSIDGIFVSNDSTATWTQKSNGMTGLSVSNMCFTRSNVLYVFRSTNVYSSADLGNTWTKLNLPYLVNGSYTSFTSAAEDLNGNIYILSTNGVYKSIDGGNTWNKKDSGLIQSQSFSIIADSNNYLYVSDLGYGVYRSINGGDFWQQMCTGLSDTSIYYLGLTRHNTLLAGSFSAIPSFYRSIDTANNWIPSTAFADEGRSVYKLLTLKSNTIIGLVGAHYHYTSNDDGITWNQVNTIKEWYDMAEDKNRKLYAVNYNTSIQQSNDTGITWHSYCTFPLYSEYLAIDSSGIIFVGSKLGIFKSTDSLLYTNIASQNNEQSLKIFPNPTNNKITIETLSTNKDKSISIYNLQGQLLFQQTSKYKNTEIDVSRFPNGMYFVKVESDTGMVSGKFVKE